MPIHPWIRRLPVLLAALLALNAGGSAADAAAAASSPGLPDPGLAEGFLHPPDAARPLTWWHWISGNISREGITADLEAMKRIGLGGAQIFTADQSEVKGPVVFMSPEWRQLMHHAIAESDRLGLELTMANCEGWSESGGPWITPAQSMQKVVWAESEVAGGHTVNLAVPQPLAERGYYEDIALLAFPTASDDRVAAPAITSSADSAGNPASWRVLPLPTPDHPQWVRMEFDRPRPFCSLRIAGKGLRDLTGPVQWELQVSDDGQAFRTVTPVPTHGTTSFPETTGRVFRVWMPVAPPRTPRIEFTEVTLGGLRLDRPEARSGMAVDRAVNAFTDSPAPASGVIRRQDVVTLTGRTEWEAPPGEWTLVRIGHTSTGIMNHPASPATAGLECDKLSRAAVTTHFEQGMIGTVLADAGPLVGTGLKYLLCDSWEAGCENWTPLMREEFRKRRGYELDPWLPALTGRVVESVDASERFLWDFRRTIADLVAENHYGVLQELAHAHHLGLYAEAVGIGLPTIADELQCKGRTDIPMGEFWVGQNRLDDTKEAASAAHIYGQNIAGAESFTATTEFAAWARDPYSLKAQGDLEFCLGINRFIFHRYAHQPWLDRKPGMSMGPWGTNFERTNTWWEPAAAWMTYLTRCQFLLQRGQFAADVCYYYGEGAPVDLVSARLTPTLPAGYDYDACDAELLVNRMSVDHGRLTLPSGMSYRVLVLPDTDRMSLPVLRKVRELVRAGATVVGPRPSKSPSLQGFPESDMEVQAIANEVWGNCDGRTVTSHADGAGRLVWGGDLGQAIGAAPDFASADPDLRFIHRRDAAAEIYFVSNQRAAEAVVECTFRVNGLVPELWHPDTGRCEVAAMYASHDGRVTLPVHFDPCGSVFVIFRQPAASEDPLVSVKEEREIWSPVTAPPAESASAAEPPTLVDGKIGLTVWQSGTYAFQTAQGRTLTATAADIPAPLELTGAWRVNFPPNLGAPAAATLDPLGSWTDSKNDGVKYFSGTAIYLKEFTLPDGWLRPDAQLYLDLGEVKNLAEVTLNGQPLGILWKAPFRVEITPAAQTGVNRLEVKITNLWPNRLIGDQKLPESQRIAWSSFYPYKADSQLLVSGLLGPAWIRVARRIQVVAP